jgi:putative SOS response-associated peptidase YedK
VIVADAQGKRVMDMKWGCQLRTQVGAKLLVNAKSETISSLPTFKPYLEQRRSIPTSLLNYSHRNLNI